MSTIALSEFHESLVNYQTEDVWGTLELTMLSEVRICNLASLTGNILPEASSLVPALLNRGTVEKYWVLVLCGATSGVWGQGGSRGLTGRGTRYLLGC